MVCNDITIPLLSMCLPPKLSWRTIFEGDIFAKGGSFSFRRTWGNYIPAVTPNNKIVLNFARKIIDFGTSYIVSNPIRYMANEDGEEIEEYIKKL